MPTRIPLIQHAPIISPQEFARFQAFLKERTGITLSDLKQALVQSRLGSRLRNRGVRSFSEYYKLLQNPTEAEELQTAIDLLTTNETSFFREPSHFDYLRSFITGLRPVPFPFRAWSAAASTGAEAYTLAMILADLLGAAEWEVVGTDISTRVLERARRGIYPMDMCKPIPKDFLTRFCLRGEGPQEGSFMVSRALRTRTTFIQANLCQPLPDIGQFDVIFLRNILIYFEAPEKEKVIRTVSRRLKPHGVLVLGHSESLSGISHSLQQVRPTVYRVLP